MDKSSFESDWILDIQDRTAAPLSVSVGRQILTDVSLLGLNNNQ